MCKDNWYLNTQANILVTEKKNVVSSAFQQVFILNTRWSTYPRTYIIKCVNRNADGNPVNFSDLENLYLKKIVD